MPADPTAPRFDFKAAMASAAPAELQRAMIREHAFQRAFYLRSAPHTGRHPRGSLFAVVEQHPSPPGVAVMTVAPSLAAVAEQEVDRAVALAPVPPAGEWPGYPAQTAYVEGGDRRGDTVWAAAARPALHRSVQMALAGCSMPQIAALAGWKIDHTQRIVDTYVPRRGDVALGAVEQWESGSDSAPGAADLPSRRRDRMK